MTPHVLAIHWVWSYWSEAACGVVRPIEYAFPVTGTADKIRQRRVTCKRCKAVIVTRNPPAQRVHYSDEGGYPACRMWWNAKREPSVTMRKADATCLRCNKLLYNLIGRG